MTRCNRRIPSLWIRRGHYIFLALIWAFPNVVLSQNYTAKVYAGALFYHGDLTEYIISAESNPGFGISIGRNINSWMTLSARFLGGKLSGDDKNALNYQVRQRNLSFTTPLYEFTVYSDINLNKLFWKKLDKYKLRLYVSGGVGLFKFNPRTWYQNRWVDLHPVGTEGQNIQKYQENRYSLLQVCIPLGFIAEIDIFEAISLGMEISPRITFTDYIDDVSTFYINRTEMLDSGNVLGAALNNRQGEFVDQHIEVSTGTPRGNDNLKDWYSFLSLYVKYSFGKT